MESWCGWAFLGYDIEHMSVELKRENIEIVEYIEKQAGWRFPPGFQEDLPSARLTLDPVFATQRPFFIYGTIWGVNTLTHMVLWAQGFRKRHDCSTYAQIIYHRKGTDSRATPLFFVHGIGIGFGHYLAFISMLPREIDVYLVEWPHVAMQVTYHIVFNLSKIS